MIGAFPLGVVAALMTAEQRAQFARPGFLVSPGWEARLAAAAILDHRTGDSHLVPVVAVDLHTEPQP